MKAGERALAVAALKDDLRAIPNDAGTAGQLVQLLSERGPDGRPPACPSDLARPGASPARSPAAIPRDP